jgi:hypothetical protein
MHHVTFLARIKRPLGPARKSQAGSGSEDVVEAGEHGGRVVEDGESTRIR